MYIITVLLYVIELGVGFKISHIYETPGTYHTTECSPKINLALKTIQSKDPYLYPIYSNRLALNEDSFACVVPTGSCHSQRLNCSAFMAKNGCFMFRWPCYFYFRSYFLNSIIGKVSVDISQIYNIHTPISFP